MYVIIGEEWPDYGYTYDCYGCVHHCHASDPKTEPVALFDRKRDAEEYIRKSRLKVPQAHRIFRRKSLLSYYRTAWVDEHYPEDLPVNPEI